MKTFVNLQYSYAEAGDMIATFQTKTDNGDGTFTYGSYDATIIDPNDKATILNILNAL